MTTSAPSTSGRSEPLQKDEAAWIVLHRPDNQPICIQVAQIRYITPTLHDAVKGARSRVQLDQGVDVKESSAEIMEMIGYVLEMD